MVNKNPALSIIVPVYNAAKYLDRCLQSIMDQTYKAYEVILVDDGSLDTSCKICERYTNEDSRFIYLFKENGGSTSARKAGLTFASGEYITFVDSDDWLDRNFLEKLMNAMETYDADIAMSDAVFEYGDHNKEIRTVIPAGLYKDRELRGYFFPNMFYHGLKKGWGIRPTLWGKIYKKELIKRHLMQLDERMFYGEDTACVFPCCLDAKCICVVDGFGYRYRMNPESVSNSSNTNIFLNIYLIYNHLHSYFNRSEISVILNKQLIIYVYSLLDFALNKVLNIHVSIEAYREKTNKKTLWLLPEKIRYSSRKVVLFGAGNVGKSYKFQLDQNEQCEVMAWTDNNYRDILKKEVLPLMDLKKALSVEYDAVVIAVAQEESAAKIKEQLLSLGVLEQKIIWDRPMPLRNVFYEL